MYWGWGHRHGSLSDCRYLAFQTVQIVHSVTVRGRLSFLLYPAAYIKPFNIVCRSIKEEGSWNTHDVDKPGSL